MKNALEISSLTKQMCIKSIYPDEGVIPHLSKDVELVHITILTIIFILLKTMTHVGTTII